MNADKQALKQEFTAYWSYLALNAACKLRLFDLIAQGQDSAAVLAQGQGWQEAKLQDLIRFLCQNGYLQDLGQGRLANSSKGELLRADKPQGLYYACRNWAEEHLISWQHLDYSIRSGQSAFEQVYQQPFFDYLRAHPDKLADYHRAMYQYALDDYQDLGHKLDFGRHASIMDVGGGLGALISQLKAVHPQTSCMLFDLEEVIALAQVPEIEKIGGSFFEEIPACAEALILSRILHDWDDARAAQILANCYTALPPGGSLYLIENCAEFCPVDLSLLSLNMAALCQSHERSAQAYTELAQQAGFRLEGQTPLNDLQTILSFCK